MDFNLAAVGSGRSTGTTGVSRFASGFARVGPLRQDVRHGQHDPRSPDHPESSLSQSREERPARAWVVAPRAQVEGELYAESKAERPRVQDRGIVDFELEIAAWLEDAVEFGQGELPLVDFSNGWGDGR